MTDAERLKQDRPIAEIKSAAEGGAAYPADTLWLIAKLAHLRYTCGACGEELDHEEVDCAENVDGARLCGDCFGRWYDGGAR